MSEQLPDGYVYAKYSGSGVVKVPEQWLGDGETIPEAILGPGDVHVIKEGEAWESSNWTPSTEGGRPLPKKENPLDAPDPPSTTSDAPDPPADESGDDD